MARSPPCELAEAAVGTGVLANGVAARLPDSRLLGSTNGTARDVAPITADGACTVVDEEGPPATSVSGLAVEVVAVRDPAEAEPSSAWIDVLSGRTEPIAVPKES